MTTTTAPRTRRHPLRPAVLVVVAAGGAVGALARHAVGLWAPVEPGTFPWSTFAVNVLGTALLALLPALAVVRRHELLPPLLGTGLLGGFTTLSLYADETRALLADGHATLAAAYLVGTLAACLLAVALADRFSTRRDRVEFAREEGDL